MLKKFFIFIIVNIGAIHEGERRGQFTKGKKRNSLSGNSSRSNRRVNSPDTKKYILEKVTSVDKVYSIKRVSGGENIYSEKYLRRIYISIYNYSTGLNKGNIFPTNVRIWISFLIKINFLSKI